MHYDAWLTRDRADEVAVPDERGCYHCNGNGEEADGPCEREVCQDEAESQIRIRRIIECRRARGECLHAALRCLLMAARYVAEGASLAEKRVTDCIEQGHAWRDQAADWQAKLDEILGVQIVNIEGVRHAAE
jgi:hypothetical protein